MLSPNIRKQFPRPIGETLLDLLPVHIVFFSQLLQDVSGNSTFNLSRYFRQLALSP
jgi:hypothetical protein